MSLRVENLIESDLQMMLAEFDRDRSIPHQGTKGGSREDLLIRFLRRRLATRFGISSGHLITSNSQWSRQLDVIVYDQFDSPLVEDLGHDRIIFVESAAVTIEVKSTLTGAELRDINEKAARTRELSRERRFLNPGPETPTILNAAFAFDSLLSIERISETLRDDDVGTEIDMLCVLRDSHQKAGFFLTDRTHGIMLLPENAGESGNAALRKFLFHLLLHVQSFSRFAIQPDLSAYLNVFGIDKLKRLQSLMTKALKDDATTREEITELIYLVGEVPGVMSDLIQHSDSLFAFEGEHFPDGTMNVEVWTYTIADGTKRYVHARSLWDAARRMMAGTALADDQTLLNAVMPYFQRLRAENKKLVIKPVPEAKG